jgi:hypothetical protein
MCEMYTWRKAKLIHKRQTIFSSERMLHKDYGRKGSVKKESGRESQVAWCQEELNDRKSLVLKYNRSVVAAVPRDWV